LIERGLEPLIGFEQRMPIIRRGDTGAGKSRLGVRRVHAVCCIARVSSWHDPEGPESND
jgi:hypothetical protein